jgi:Ca2+-binding EF-hand superfamily protein
MALHIDKLTLCRKALGEILAGFKYKFSSAIVNKLPELFTKSGTDEIHFQEYFTLLVQLKNLDKQFQEHNAAKKQVFLGV